MKILISEVHSKNNEETVFYAREQPYDPGRSYEATATTLDGIKWTVKRIREPYELSGF